MSDEVNAMRSVPPEEIARLFHEHYEKHAPGFDYDTRAETAVPWDEVPEQNKTLMVATVTTVLAELMAAETENAEPTEIPGHISGPGGPHDWGGVVLDATNAVLVDSIDVALVDTLAKGERSDDPVVSLTLGGRLNKRQDRAQVMFLMNASDGAAGIVSELMALMQRAGAGVGDAFLERLRVRMDRMP